MKSDRTKILFAAACLVLAAAFFMWNFSAAPSRSAGPQGGSANSATGENSDGAGQIPQTLKVDFD